MLWNSEKSGTWLQHSGSICCNFLCTILPPPIVDHQFVGSYTTFRFGYFRFSKWRRTIYSATMSVCLESSRSRDGLKLPLLNRSKSEPGPPSLNILASTPPKRCKLDTSSVSLPASPCAESSSIQRSLILKKVRCLDADGLRLKLDQGRPRNFVLLDCRSFTAYNLNHIVGSMNVNCSDRYNRKRLQRGKATLADLASTRDSKETLRKMAYKEVIVYDEATTDKDRITTTHPLFLVLSSIVEENKEPTLLLGEFRNFKKLPHLGYDS